MWQLIVNLSAVIVSLWACRSARFGACVCVTPAWITLSRLHYAISKRTQCRGEWVVEHWPKWRQKTYNTIKRHLMREKKEQLFIPVTIREPFDSIPFSVCLQISHLIINWRYSLRPCAWWFFFCQQSSIKVTAASTDMWIYWPWLRICVCVRVCARVCVCVCLIGQRLIITTTTLSWSMD